MMDLHRPRPRQQQTTTNPSSSHHNVVRRRLAGQEAPLVLDAHLHHQTVIIPKMTRPDPHPALALLLAHSH